MKIIFLKLEAFFDMFSDYESKVVGEYKGIALNRLYAVKNGVQYESEKVSNTGRPMLELVRDKGL